MDEKVVSGIKAQVMNHATGDGNSMNFQFVLHMQPLYKVKSRQKTNVVTYKGGKQC